MISWQASRNHLVLLILICPKCLTPYVHTLTREEIGLLDSYDSINSQGIVGMTLSHRVAITNNRIVIFLRIKIQIT